jgi:hypothetical protein
MTASRRLAAILAADVAGHSRLMGADEVGTYERLKVHRRELRIHQQHSSTFIFVEVSNYIAGQCRFLDAALVIKKTIDFTSVSDLAPVNATNFPASCAGSWASVIL